MEDLLLGYSHARQTELRTCARRKGGDDGEDGTDSSGG
jgi:hypothetical protein